MQFAKASCGSSGVGRSQIKLAGLSYSRRLFVRAFLNERQDDWREGLAAAFVHFGGVARTMLGDHARGWEGDAIGRPGR